MSLDAHVTLRRGSLDLDVRLAVATAETVAVVGPNGAGKTTLLRALCGLTPLGGGHVEVDGVAWDDVAGGTHLPTHRRSVGVVFQDLRLLPHLTLLENVAFGLRSRGVGGAEARREAATWLDRLGLGTRRQSRPAELSGGEAQRVALARALAVRPQLLLLDEPTAAADAGARGDLRALVLDELTAYEGTRLLVTHDPAEADALAARVIVLDAGRVVAQRQGRLAPTAGAAVPGSSRAPRGENGPRHE